MAVCRGSEAALEVKLFPVVTRTSTKVVSRMLVINNRDVETVKFALERAMKAQRGSRGIVLLFP